jgi:transcription elongation factor Elf1
VGKTEDILHCFKCDARLSVTTDGNGRVVALVCTNCGRRVAVHTVIASRGSRKLIK